MNQFVLVGRILDNMEKDDIITIGVTNKNNEECVINLVDIVIKGKIAVTTKEYCKKDDVIAIKGSIQTEPINGENKIKLVAERITFLTSKRYD